MSEIIRNVAVGGLMFCGLRLLDMVWPTKILPGTFYFSMAIVWFFVLAWAVHP